MRIEYSRRQRLIKDVRFVLLGTLAIFLVTAGIGDWFKWQWRHALDLFGWMIVYVRVTNVFLLAFFFASQWLVVDEKTRMRVWALRGFLIGLISGIQFYAYQNGLSHFTMSYGFGRLVETVLSILWLPFLSAFIGYKLGAINDDKVRTTYAQCACAVIAYGYFTLLMPYRQ